MHNDSDSGLMLFSASLCTEVWMQMWLGKQQFYLSHCNIVYTKHSSGGSVFLKQEGEKKTTGKLRRSLSIKGNKIDRNENKRLSENI